MATHQKSTTLLINKKDVVLVKPAKPTPSEILSFSTIDNDPNLEILCQTLYVYRANPTSESADPVLVVKEALSKALVYYYPLAGKLKRNSNGRLQITCNGDGVPFMEAFADCELSSLNYFDGTDVKIGQQFVFDWPTDHNKTGYHPLVLQVTRFSCGGFTIGMGLSHSVCDGFGAAQFFRAMAELASGKENPSVKPVWEREILVGEASSGKDPFDFVDKTTLAMSPFLPPVDGVSHQCFNVDAESIRLLKKHFAEEAAVLHDDDDDDDKSVESLTEPFTTLEVLAAYVWRSRIRALKQNPDGTTILCLAVGIRKLMSDPPLPAGYYGNAFVSANVVLPCKNLDQGPLCKIAELIKSSKKTVSRTDQIRSSIDSLEAFVQMNTKVEGGGGATFVLTDWRQLRLSEEVDFGWKSSVNMVPLPWEMFGYVDLCIFLPPCRANAAMEGGVRVLVSLPGAAMATFNQEMDGIKKWCKDNGMPH